MRRISSIVLLLTFLCFGTGLFEYLHNLHHQYEDRIAAINAHKHGQKTPAAPIHDESNCFVHGQLHIAQIPVAWIPLLVLLGLFVAFLTQIAVPLISQRQLFRIDCRGPPVIA